MSNPFDGGSILHTPTIGGVCPDAIILSDYLFATPKEVREAIKRIGGTMPEDLPPGEHIKRVEKRLKKAKPKLELEGPDARGLAGGGRTG